jgi:MFS family permease
LPSRAWLVLGGVALSAVGSGLTLPFFLVYLSSARGIDIGLAGLMLSTLAAAGLAGNPAGGWLVDRLDARRAVIVGLVLAACGCAAIALVHVPWQGFLAAALYGLGTAVLLPAEDALLATVVEPERRPHVFALRHATLNAGFSVGALAAAVVVATVTGPTGFVVLYLADAASFLAFAALLTTWFRAVAPPDATRDEGACAPGSYRDVLRDPVFVRVWLVVLFLVAAGYAQYHAAFPAFATSVGGLSAWGLSIAFAANTVTVVAAQLVVLRLMAGRRRTRGVVLSAVFTAACWLTTLAAAGSGAQLATVLFAVAMVIFGIGETLLSPTLPAIVNDLAPDELRGRYNGAYSLAWTTGFIVGPAVAGLALAAGHGYALFVGFVAVLAIAAVGAWRLERHIPSAINHIGAGEDLERQLTVAEAHRAQGRYADAEELFRAALRRAEEEFGPDAFPVADACNGLAVTYKYSGRFDDAEALYARALRILERQLGAEHPDVAAVHHNLGGLAHARGRFAEAEAPARRAVAIREAALGPDHVDVAADKAALASILDAIGRGDEAEQLLTDALAAFERALGPSHYEIAVNLHNLASLHHRRGETAQAEPLYRRALDMKEDLLGPDHPDLATTLSNLALARCALGDPREAHDLVERAIAILDRSVEPDHPTLVNCREVHADLRSALDGR